MLPTADRARRTSAGESPARISRSRFARRREATVRLQSAPAPGTARSGPGEKRFPCGKPAQYRYNGTLPVGGRPLEAPRRKGGEVSGWRGLLRLAAAIDAVSRTLRPGSPPGWCCSSCLISAGNAASRYLFSLSSNAWLEIQWQMFAGIFLLGARLGAEAQRARPGRPALRQRLAAAQALDRRRRASSSSCSRPTLMIGWFAWPFFLDELPRAARFVERRRPAGSGR